MFSHCVNGGLILGNAIDGTQAEFVRIPYADTSLYPNLAGEDEDPLVMCSDILPTAFECGVLNGKVAPGSTQFNSPAQIIVIDLDEKRLAIAKNLGATHTINSRDGNAADAVRKITAQRGVDAAIEAVGIPATFELCEELVAPSGTIANIGVHGKHSISSVCGIAISRSRSRRDSSMP